MSSYDVVKSNDTLVALIEKTENPRHKWLLEAYLRHRCLEVAGRFEEIFAPDMMVDHPIYNFNRAGKAIRLEGAEAVKGIYRQWTETGECIMYSWDEKIAVGDNLICSDFVLAQQVPGANLVEEGLDVDPNETYLMINRQYMNWPYDDEGRLIGEDVWEVDDSTREYIRLEPHEVLTAAQSRELLSPLIKPLSPRPF